MATLEMQLNYFGWGLDKKRLDEIRKGGAVNAEIDIQNLNWFFGMKFTHIPQVYLERYIEISKNDNYLPLVPAHDTLIKMIFDPLKSAKRCYCYGEYLAAIELVAHVAEMLAILLWEVSPKRDIKSDEFEDMGQAERIKNLKRLKIVEGTRKGLFTFLRRKRADYFHRWSQDRSKLQKDALACFSTIVRLVKEVFELKLVKNSVSINQELLKYINTLKR